MPRREQRQRRARRKGLLQLIWTALVVVAAIADVAYEYKSYGRVNVFEALMAAAFVGGIYKGVLACLVDAYDDF